MRGKWRRISWRTPPGFLRPTKRERSLSLRFEFDVPAIESCSFAEGDVGEINIVLCQGADFVGTRLCKIVLELEHDETGTLAALEFPLLCLQGVFSVLGRFAPGGDL